MAGRLLNLKTGIIAVSVLLFIIILVWLFVESSKPLPGTKTADEGRGHVPLGEEVKYVTNPPTSGKHYEDWTRSGVYDSPKDDRNLVHSLEHGYVIMSYKCSEGSSESSEDCKAHHDQLAKIYEQKGKKKLIVLPRPNLDTNFVLTSWDYIDKFNDFDKGRIEKFIDAHLNQGPEKTME